MGREERVPLDYVLEVREGLAEVRASVRHLEGDVADLRQELRQSIERLDSRLFQLVLTQLATLGAALGALVASLAA